MEENKKYIHIENQMCYVLEKRDDILYESSPIFLEHNELSRLSLKQLEALFYQVKNCDCVYESQLDMHTAELLQEAENYLCQHLEHLKAKKQSIINYLQTLRIKSIGDFFISIEQMNGLLEVDSSYNQISLEQCYEDSKMVILQVNSNEPKCGYILQLRGNPSQHGVCLLVDVQNEIEID